LGANIADHVGSGRRRNAERNDEENSGKDKDEDEAPLPHLNTHRLMMNEAVGSCKYDAQAAMAYWLSAWARISIISWKVAISKFRIERLCTSPSKTGLEGQNSFNRISRSRAQRSRNASIPKPPPPMASTSDRSKAMMRAAFCACTTLRSWKTESLRMILPLHSTTARSLRFSTCMASM